MQPPLLAPTFLFRFAVPCRRLSALWSETEIELPPKFRLPSFGELEGRPLFADLRLGWCPDGFAVSVRVQNKKQQPWCRVSRLEDSDGLSLWFDTRQTQSIHRASRFCHRFVCLPAGEGDRQASPVARLVGIQRAKEHPKSISPELLKVRSEKRVDGYLLRAAIPAAALTGFDPQESKRVGFCYAATDRELGWQTFSIGTEFPFTSDPSLWGTLELVG